ncbi:MAG: DUF2911 domain-containing protein [Flavobacteriales bacterium]
MKRINSILGALAVLMIVLSTPVTAQTNSTNTAAKKDERPSPPMVAEKDLGAGLKVTIRYNAPGVKGRTIWGDLVPYGKVWRTGANEATTIEVSRDAKLEGNGLFAGRYALFTIPGETEWTVIINKVADQWGAYKYDESKDAFRFTVKPERGEFKERLEFNISDNGRVTLAWENVVIGFNIM